MTRSRTRFTDVTAPKNGAHADPAWHLYVIRTIAGSLYAGITTDVERRYREHASGSPKAARFLRAHPPAALAFKRRIGTRSLALKVEYRFKQLPKRVKEAIVKASKMRIDRVTGAVKPVSRQSLA